MDIPVLKNYNCIIGTNNHGSVTAYSGDVVYENLRGVSDTNGVAWQTLDPIKVVCIPDEGYELDQILKYDNEDITYLAEASGFFSLYPDTDNDKWIAVFFKKKKMKNNKEKVTVTISTNSAGKSYNGEPLAYNYYTFSPSSYNGHEIICDGKCTGSITEIGLTANTIDIYLLYFADGYDGAELELEYNLGTLTIYGQIIDPEDPDPEEDPDDPDPTIPEL